MSNSPAALAELIRAPLSKDYRTLDMRHARVILLEATDTLLSAMPERLRAYALAWLGKMGVQVRLRAVASQVTPESVQLQDGTLISTETVGWTAGVRGDPQAGTWGLPVARNGQVIVLPTLQVPDHPEVYVLGDLARVEQNGQPLPMIAPVAIQQGMTVARNIAHQAAGQSPRLLGALHLRRRLLFGRHQASGHA